MFDTIKEVVNDADRAPVLEKHLEFVTAQYEALQLKHSDLEDMYSQLNSDFDDLEIRFNKLQSELQSLKTGQLATVVCDHCGNSNIKRVGSRPHHAFGDSGLKEAIFHCNQFDQESYVELPPAF